jgi:hypothetical protein
VLDRGDDPGALVGDGLGELAERFESTSPGPLDPAVEQRDRRGRWEAVDLTELFFQEVRAIEALVGLLDVGELDLLAGGEVLGVFPQREPRALEVLCDGDFAAAPGLVPDLAADLVQRVGRQRNDVEGVHAAHRVGEAVGDRASDPARHVARHQFDLFAAFLAQRVEERLDGLAVTPRGRPHQPAAVVIDDDGQVALALAVRDLIDPDPLQTGQQVDVALGFGGDALADAADGAPRHAHQLSDRRLGGVDGQPRSLVFERRGEPGVMTRPRDRTDHDTVTATRHPRRIGLDMGKRRPEVQRAPAPPAVAEIKPRRPSPTDPAAIPLAPARPDRRHHHLPLNAAVDVLDHRPLQTQQPRPCPCAAHVASSSSRFQPSRSRTPRLGAACTPPHAFTSTHGNNRSASNRPASPALARNPGYS